MEKTKQTIIIRKDLNMRKGKMCAQSAHAALGAILQLMTEKGEFLKTFYRVRELQVQRNSALDLWLDGESTKITLYVESEEELLKIYEQAKNDGLNVCLITDVGNTEFKGVPTNTCLAIGPDFESKIDKITKNIKLL